MSPAPSVRSFALQKSLPVTPVRQNPAQKGAFASMLAKAQARAPLVPTASRSVQRAAPTPAIPFHDEIVSAATRHGIDPALLAAVVKVESNFKPTAQSGAGAKGLTQLMDATARGLGVTNAFDPAQSLDAGAKFLGGLLKQFHGNEGLALAAYNAGPGAVQKYGGIPPYQETQRYVPKVLGFATQFRRIMRAHD